LADELRVETSRVSTASDSLMHILPADALIAYAGVPPQNDDDRNGGVSRLLALADGARALGLLPDSGRIFADIGSAFPLLGTYPHALALLDISTKQVGPESHRLASLQAVLILRTGENTDPVVRRIERFLLAYTNDQVSRIVPVQQEMRDAQSGATFTLSYHRLTDSRWPTWIAVEWGRVGDLYVIGVGQGAWPRCARAILGEAPSLGRNAWFERAFADCRGADARIHVYLNAAGVTDRLDESTGGVSSRVWTELGMAAVERRYWTADQTDRAVNIFQASQTDGQYSFVQLTSPTSNAGDARATIPDQAERYAIVRLNAGRTIDSLVRAYLSARSPDVRAMIADWWVDFQSRAGVDARNELLDPIGDTAVLHTWPPHPLGLSILSTMLFEIRGDPIAFRKALDALLETPSLPTTQPASRPTRSPFSSGWRKTHDGIWYYQRGMVVILGMAVAERWLVVSFSPEAVRDNFRVLAARPGDAADDSEMTESRIGETGHPMAETGGDIGTNEPRSD